ncbi:MAG: IPT/TIG domain-containing protein, partial [Gammaproteobacteria bacterium]
MPRKNKGQHSKAWILRCGKVWIVGVYLMKPWGHGVLAGARHLPQKGFIARTFYFLSQLRFAHIVRQCLIPVLLLTACWTSASYASNYFYDANGRLVAVTAPSGSSVVYTYDAVGNILSIQPIVVGQLALFAFSPGQGTVNTTVTIQGNGFSTTAASNTVKFNGTATSVTSATATQLVVKVPNGASTGPISVTVGGSTVTSATDFTVVQAPSITSFTPTLAALGTAVTVSGSALDPVPDGTNLTLGGLAVPINSASNSQLAFSVPPSVGSGPIGVTTPYGQATSSTDLIVVPSAIGAANVVATAQLTEGGAANSLNINATNKYGVFVFNASAGQWLSVQLASLTTSPSGGSVSYTVYSPANVQVMSGTVSVASNMSIHLPAASMSGSFLVAFSSGNDTVQLSASVELNATLNSNGTTVPLTTTTAAQSKRLIFNVSTGQNLGFGITSLSVNPSSSAEVFVSVYNPDGTYVYDPVDGVYWSGYPAMVSSGGLGLKLVNLAQTGTYSVVVQPNGAATMSFNATVS